MEYYEYWYIVQELIEYLKKEKEANEGQNQQTNEMMGNMSQNMKMPNMKMPSMNMPKMPKM
jgi:hypothetical protein